jgi:hypothetical protein
MVVACVGFSVEEVGESQVEHEDQEENHVLLAIVVGVEDEGSDADEDSLQLSDQFKGFFGKVGHEVKPDSGHDEELQEEEEEAHEERVEVHQPFFVFQVEHRVVRILGSRAS